LSAGPWLRIPEVTLLDTQQPPINRGDLLPCRDRLSTVLTQGLSGTPPLGPREPLQLLRSPQQSCHSTQAWVHLLMQSGTNRQIFQTNCMPLILIDVQTFLFSKTKTVPGASCTVSITGRKVSVNTCRITARWSLH
jgi:hypothetical protein